MNYQGMTALITGASSGLGEEFARQLAAEGCHLILVARSKDKLDRLAAELAAQYGVKTRAIAADLALSEAVDRTIAAVKQMGDRVDILVNNAGFGVFDDFLRPPFARQIEQVDVNVRALVALTQAFAPGMVAAKHGGIINLGSTAAFQPLPGAGVYAASKAFVLFFSEALSLELEQSNVRVLAACPGPVATRFFHGMNPKQTAAQMDQPKPIVSQILRAFAKRKRLVIPGKRSLRLRALGARLLPRNTLLRLAAAFVQQLNRKAGGSLSY